MSKIMFDILHGWILNLLQSPIEFASHW